MKRTNLRYLSKKRNQINSNYLKAISFIQIYIFISFGKSKPQQTYLILLSSIYQLVFGSALSSFLKFSALISEIDDSETESST